MVDTMALLSALLRTARMTRRASLPDAPPPADDEAVLDAPDDRLAPALVAAARGEYTAARDLLDATRAAAEWEDRDRYVTGLAAFARSRPGWLDAWRAAAPEDQGALLVAAQLAVDRAWPSPARSELLREASPLITAAARADDRDPVPWRIALDHARGSSAGHRYFEELWEAAVRRAPHHHGCHVAALRYLATFWHGSHHECFDFAELAAQDAAPESLVQGLPVRAAFGYLADVCGPDVPRERLDAAADRAVALSGRLPAADPRAAEFRNQLLYVLLRLERWEDARAQLPLIGPYATSSPWSRMSEDALGLFLGLRESLRGQAPKAAVARLLPAPPRPGGDLRGRGTAPDH
ncbi:hypothetical protein ACIPRD_20840 [Streptomyces sp. NPDC090108]|uniref:hypothetical protein n=1 Tax=Streptomyces sp. NPDC090108 TaxID=3365947 RepID=UPI003800F96A